MDNVALVAICFILGLVLRLTGRVPDGAHRALNAVIIHFSLPGVALLYTHSLHLRPELALTALMAWIVFAAGTGFFLLAGRLAGFSGPTFACLVLTCALGNTSFVGLPMIEAFFGEQWLGVGVLADQAGTFLALSLPGLAIAAHFSRDTARVRDVAARVVSFPPLWAVFAGFALQPVAYPDIVTSLLERVASTLTPLALLSVGMAIRFGAFRGRGTELALGLSYKLVLAPLLILGLYAGLGGLSGTVIEVTIFEAAMPPIVVGSIVAMEYGLEPDLAALMLGVGIPLSFATLPAWHWVLSGI